MQVYKASNPMANNPFVNPEMSKNYFYAFLTLVSKLLYLCCCVVQIYKQMFVFKINQTN